MYESSLRYFSVRNFNSVFSDFFFQLTLQHLPGTLSSSTQPSVFAGTLPSALMSNYSVCLDTSSYIVPLYEYDCISSLRWLLLHCILQKLHLLFQNLLDISIPMQEAILTAAAPPPLAADFSVNDVPTITEFIYIPAGLLMLFFGGFLVNTSLAVLSCFVVAHCIVAIAATISAPFIPTIVLAIVSSVATFPLVLRACIRGPAFTTGAVLGACIALTFRHVSIPTLCIATLILSPAFGVIFSTMPKEVAIFVTSYGGGFLIFFGMQQVDTRRLADVIVTPEIVSIGNVDLWFSVLSFLIVGLLGCGIQLILLSNQMDRASPRARYIPIP